MANSSYRANPAAQADAREAVLLFLSPRSRAAGCER